MPSALILPDGVVPSNLHLPPGVKTRHIDSDMYSICDRLAEIDRSLYIVLLEGDSYVYAIMEACGDGVHRLIFKVKELDARVLDRISKIMMLPLDLRVKKIEEEAAKRQREYQEEEHERLYETVGRPMLTELDKCGFIDRPVSYPKVGVTSGGKRAR